MSDPRYIDRPPRIQPELPIEVIKIPSPPQQDESALAQIIQIALPLVTILGYVAMAAFGGMGRSPAMIIPMALSVVAATGFSVYMYFKEKEKRQEKERIYGERLVELNREMHNYHDMQRRFYSYNYPDQVKTFRIAWDARNELERRSRALRSESRLWERRTTDEDFGVVRLGIGTLPSTVIYELDQNESDESPQLRAAKKLEQDSRFVPHIPVILSLRAAPARDDEEEGEQEESKQVKQEESRRTPTTHALGIAGQSSAVYLFIRSLLAHFAVFHAPTDARVYVLGRRKQEWAWTDALPHSRGDDLHRYTFFVEEDNQVKQAAQRGRPDEEETPITRYLEGLRKLLAQRRLQLQESNESGEARGDPTLPFCLLVVDLLEEDFSQPSELRDLEMDPALSILLADGAALGAAVIFLVPERGKVPSGCKSVIEVERTTPATNTHSPELHRLHFRYAETGLNSFRYVGAADEVGLLEQMNALVAKLAELDVRQNSGATLASTVPFLSFMGYSTLDELEQDARQEWQESTEPHYADWLRAKLGLMAGNKPRTLVFSAKRDGVHGMVAGSTGSGKSELLISLLTGMAINYDPSILNFVLVDYKGGGAFKEFSTLPHCVDIITNLAGEGVTRMFTAINAEMRRRQALNAGSGTKDIVEYHEKGLHLVKPYPFLFIVIDEFAEMIADRAEYKAELESIARVGRAQGVSLILAAQRPTGVTDQMRANIKFRVCLRVETTGESRELLRRTDAAYLPGGVPGRGYLQVGNDEIELIQVAYSGDKYVDPKQEERRPVVWQRRQDATARRQDQEPQELYKAVIQRLDRLAHDMGVSEQRAPWPDFLPTHLSLSTKLLSEDPRDRGITSERYLHPEDIQHILLGEPREPTLSLNPAVSRWLNTEGEGWVEPLDWEQYALRPVVGLMDHPSEARQLPLVVELPRGHVVIFGASGWGKTTFLRSLVISLAATHSPNEVHFYLLDLGGRSLGVLKGLPHVGAVINPDAEGYKEQVEQMLRLMDEIVSQRKTILATAGIGHIYEYNVLHPEAPLPACVVAIDNFTEFKETFGSSDPNVESVLDRFVGLARECKPYGIHLVITASQPNILSTTLYNVFTERLTLKLGDATDYRLIVGASVAEIGDIPGRGYVKHLRQALSFQVATPLDIHRAGTEEATGETQETERLGKAMHAFITRSDKRYLLPTPIGALPGSALLRQILSRNYGFSLEEDFWSQLHTLTRQLWADSVRPDMADWLKVTIALAPGDRLRELHLEAKADGVHGLVAGGTGAGKSELLMTLIVALVLRYDPSILNFVLVDYKGGGAFKPFDDLPHCVDSVTNLNKAAVRRMFTAINAEMQRRQALNAATDTKDIVEYRKRGYHLTREPYPHLFIIIDEYAEMISDSPEFKGELESITRVGRAQGVNLLLAAQRPTGVTDQMRANIKFRICLRVEEVETSREMLRRSDAAFLPNGVPGRGYLQVGNESIELLQVAYTGESYKDEGAPEGRQETKFYDRVVDIAQALCQGERPRTPWPPPLPALLPMPQPLPERYLDARYRALLTQERTTRLALNPFLTDWLEGTGSWPGVDWNQQAMRAIVGLLDDPHNARQLPLILDLTKGHGIIFGASGWGKTTFFRSLVLTLAATHSPSEFQAHILDLGGRNLAVLSALPHVGTIIRPDDGGYQEQVQQLLRELNAIVDTRKRLFGETDAATLYEYNQSHPEQIEPAILVVIDNFAEYLETFGDAKENDPNNLLEVLIALVRQGKAYGIHFVISAGRLNVLSSKLYSLFTERLTLRLADAGEYSSIVGGRVEEIEEIPGRGYTRVERQPLAFQVALPLRSGNESGQGSQEAQQIRAIGQQMQVVAGQRYRQPLRITALPESSFYRQVLSEQLVLRSDLPFPDALFEAVRQRWAHNATAEAADWLRVTLGVASGNRSRELRLEAKRDGVHGLIAGGTGSGKSELLMTLIVGLALNYSPDILNFVLVDYKGGGAFKPFEKLPHCVDIVTNLNKAGVKRMFTAINAEIRRRQKLNADTGTKDIVEYREKGYHLTRESYPHLFVIIDEYAEMIDDNPDYQGELESITRVGRAQGVNLLLASQRPKGVTDQMRANIKLRVCLRVEQTDTSVELLRRPDAAFLPNGMPGRGYLQVGNENLELVQVAYSGDTQPEERTPAVLWPHRENQPAPRVQEEVPRLFDRAVMLANDLTGGQGAPRPWPTFLPNSLSLESPLADTQGNRKPPLLGQVSDWLNDEGEASWPGVRWEGGALQVSLGLVDDPSEAQQFPLPFDLTREHLVVYGDSGSGKSSFLRSLLVALAATHSPDEWHGYVLDLGGRNFRSLEALPHLGAVIYADDDTFEERLHRLLEKLEALTDERQQLLSAAGATTLYEYNHHQQRLNRPTLPAIVVLIDTFAPLVENHEMLVEMTLIPLVRRSLAVGITFVLSTNGPNLPSKLSALFGQRITFKQSNVDRYLDIVGRGAGELDDIPGRGYIRLKRRPLLFQAALPVGALHGPDEQDPLLEADELRRLAQNMAQAVAAQAGRWQNPPAPIATLPEGVPLLPLLEQLPPTQPTHVEALLGLSGNLSPTLVDLKHVLPHFIVTGPPLSGKTTLLYSWVLSLAYRYPPSQVAFILVDLQRRWVEYDGTQSLSALPHVLETVYTLAHLEAVTERLKSEAETLTGSEPARELFIFIDNFEDASEEIDRHRGTMGADLAGFVRQYGRRGLHFVVAGGLDSGVSELKRRIQSVGYGIGLRSAQAVEALRVSRTPSAFRGRELPVGRGYLVRSGQPTLVQAATPYDGLADPSSASPSSGVSREAAALDQWIERIQSRHPSERAAWVSGEGAVLATNGADPVRSENNKRVMALLQRALLWEAKRLQEKNGHDPVVTLALAHLGPAQWNNDAAILEMLKEVWRQELIAKSDTVIYDLVKDTGTDNVLLSMEDWFDKPNGTEATP